MKCTDCKYSVEDDFGYSNWTVEGTEVSCLLGKNPDFPIDRFYGEDPSLSFAEKCDSFVEGENTCFDVDIGSNINWLYRWLRC